MQHKSANGIGAASVAPVRNVAGGPARKWRLVRLVEQVNVLRARPGTGKDFEEMERDWAARTG